MKPSFATRFHRYLALVLWLLVLIITSSCNVLERNGISGPQSGAGFQKYSRQTSAQQGSPDHDKPELEKTIQNDRTLIGPEGITANHAISEPSSDYARDNVKDGSNDEQITNPSASGPLNQRHIAILMYHEIGEPPGGLTVTPKDFASQMELLAQAGYHTISLDTLIKWLGGEKVELPQKSIVLTFDDGYQGVYKYAYPVLKEYNYTATLFIITGLVGKPGYMSWKEIRTLANSNYAIGSHTVSHPDLRLLSDKQLFKEVTLSRETLQKAVNQPVIVFCYPAGKYNTQVINAVKEAGYLGAVTTEYGRVNRESHPFTLKRIRIDGRESLATFKRKIGL